MSSIRFTKACKIDLGEIYRYIAQDNVDAADKHRQRLEKRWLALIDHPRMGTKRDDIEPDLRSVTEGNYVIFYRILTTEIEISRVLHSSRDSQRVFAESEE